MLIIKMKDETNSMFCMESQSSIFSTMFASTQRKMTSEVSNHINSDLDRIIGKEILIWTPTFKQGLLIA